MSNIADQIKNATDELLIDSDWSANTTIVDEMNRRPEIGAEAIVALKKRLTHKKAHVGLLTLTLIDALVKNCPKFHPHIATEDFMKILLKLLETEKPSIFKTLRKSESNEDMKRLELKERVLVLIQSWGFAFANSRSYPIFSETYQNLLQSGVVFPQPHKDEVAPVFTPMAKAARPPASSKAQDAPYTDSGCKAASENAALLIEMLTASSPNEDITKNDLIQTLVRTVRDAQSQVMSRVQSNPPEGVMMEILRVNDKLVESLQYYDNLRTGKISRPKPESVKPTEIKQHAAVSAASQIQQVPQAQPANTDFDIFSGPFSNGSASNNTVKPLPIATSSTSIASASSTTSPTASTTAEGKGEKKLPVTAIPVIAPPPINRKPTTRRAPSKSLQVGEDGHIGESPQQAPSQNPPAKPVNSLDLLDSLFSLPPASSPATSQPQAAAVPSSSPTSAPNAASDDGFAELMTRKKPVPSVARAPTKPNAPNPFEELDLFTNP